MGETPSISPERIRRFALDGGLTDEAANHFLDSQCHMLQMRNIHALVAQEVLPHIMSVGLVVGVTESTTPECLSVAAWVPHDHSRKILESIRETYKRHGIPNPYEYTDLENLDTATVGRDYVRAMLIRYEQEHGKTA